MTALNTALQQSLQSVHNIADTLLLGREGVSFVAIRCIKEDRIGPYKRLEVAVLPQVWSVPHISCNDPTYVLGHSWVRNRTFINHPTPKGTGAVPQWTKRRPS